MELLGAVAVVLVAVVQTLVEAAVELSEAEVTAGDHAPAVLEQALVAVQSRQQGLRRAHGRAQHVLLEAVLEVEQPAVAEAGDAAADEADVEAVPEAVAEAVLKAWQLPAPKAAAVLCTQAG